MKKIEIDPQAIVQAIRTARALCESVGNSTGAVDADVVTAGRRWLPKADARDILAISRGLATLIVTKKDGLVLVSLEAT